ncbi:MAG: PilN domain-containing protein [Planctomycetota bacterium]|nr:PilN domain-containing protein [Planctomycetota bacterium]
MLGLAVEERAIAVAEVHASRGERRVALAARFELPADAGWDRPAELGAKLGAFLKERGFTAKRAVVGLPGRWVLIRARTLPPTPAAAVGGVLRLAAEREYPGEASEWALDFAGSTAADAKSSVLLAATPRERLSRLVAAMAGAGLAVERVTATTLALAEADVAPRAGSPSLAGGAALLHLAADGAELAVRSRGTVVALERLSAGTGPALEGEIRRVLAAAVAATSASTAPGTLLVWNDAAVEAASLTDLARRLGMEMRVDPGVAGLPVDGKVSSTAGAGSAAAAALAAGAVSPPSASCTGIDFLHSRLAVAPPRRFTRPRVAAIALAVALLAFVLYLFGDRFWQQYEINRLQAQLDDMKGDLAAARASIDKTTLARGWFDHRPRLLDCLRAVTLAFPTSGNVWATSLSLRDDMTGTLAGKAQSEKAAADLIDRLRASKRFTNVRPVDLHQVDKTGRAVSFAVTFAYVGQE